MATAKTGGAALSDPLGRIKNFFFCLEFLDGVGAVGGLGVLLAQRMYNYWEDGVGTSV